MISQSASDNDDPCCDPALRTTKNKKKEILEKLHVVEFTTKKIDLIVKIAN